MEVIKRVPFKEKGKEKFYFESGKWISTNEEMINSLWFTWANSKGIKRYYDKDGFLLFTYEEIDII